MVVRRVALACALFLGLSAAPPAARAEPLLLVGDEAHPPFSYDRGGEPAGIYVDVIREALAMMPGVEARIEVMPWKRALKTVEQGQAAAVFPPYFWPQERPWMDYSAPILVESIVLVCRADVPDLDRRQYPTDYAGLVFLNNLGSLAPGPGLLEMARQGKVTLMEMPGTEDAVRRLVDRGADCYVNDRHAIEAGLAALPPREHRAELVLVQPVAGNQGYLGYRKGADIPGLAAFRAGFDRAVERLRREGRIKAIIENHTRGVSLAERTP